ncbi:MAG: 2Fe-2S iron-sulfur cluster-binding protein [Acidimicrobiia bacterium]|nr:2Fe-2S iron-sulfur cluster-binding protein [Acidimicrobiia bacterium]
MSDVQVTIDGVAVSVSEGTTILEACRAEGTDQPTLCYLETLTPVNTCRVCVVQVAGSRTLVPSCSRVVEDGMDISTDSPPVRQTRKMVFEFLASSVDLSLVDDQTQQWMDYYEVDPTRYGPAAPDTPAGARDGRPPGHHAPPADGLAETVGQPVKVDNDLYVRDYAKCILCYKCVEACGPDAQNTFAIQVAGRGFDARISTEFDVALTDSACVYCGNCIGVCPTGALMFRSEYELREADLWREEEQSVTRTVCSFCGVGCNLELHVQDNRIVKVTSPIDHSVTDGHLCIKGRFGYEYVQELGDLATTPIDLVLEAARTN